MLETITYDYNLQNRLVSVSDGSTTVTYKYNPDGIRVQADDGTTVTDYLIDAYNHTGYAQVLEEWSGGEHPDITYTIGDDVITQYSSSPGAEHLLYDGHGSTGQLVDSNEDITEAYSYDAYGFMLGGNPARGSSPATNLLYAGEWFDTDMQHYYLRARYYDQNTGRFNRLDPFAGNNRDPQSLHKYLYAHCSPIMNVDPTGMMLGGGSFSLGEVVFVSAMMATLSGMVTYNYTGSVKAAVIVGASAFVLSFVALGGVGLTIAAITGGSTVSSPYLLNPNTWQEAESMLRKVLQLPKNTIPYFEQGMTTYRIPDFVHRGRFIADSKWRDAIYMSDQLRDFERLAKAWDVSLHLYVRVGTHVSQPVIDLVNRTNGLIIRIFE